MENLIGDTASRMRGYDNDIFTWLGDDRREWNFTRMWPLADIPTFVVILMLSLLVGLLHFIINRIGVRWLRRLVSKLGVISLCARVVMWSYIAIEGALLMYRHSFSFAMCNPAHSFRPVGARLIYIAFLTSSFASVSPGARSASRIAALLEAASLLILTRVAYDGDAVALTVLLASFKAVGMLAYLHSAGRGITWYLLSSLLEAALSLFAAIYVTALDDRCRQYSPLTPFMAVGALTFARACAVMAQLASHLFLDDASSSASVCAPPRNLHCATTTVTATYAHTRTTRTSSIGSAEAQAHGARLAATGYGAAYSPAPSAGRNVYDSSAKEDQFGAGAGVGAGGTGVGYSRPQPYVAGAPAAHVYDGHPPMRVGGGAGTGSLGNSDDPDADDVDIAAAVPRHERVRQRQARGPTRED